MKLQLGKHNNLQVLRIRPQGVYLEGNDIVGDILLPNRYVPEGVKVGDRIRVFLYLDHEERLIATTQHPLVEVGQFAYLECKWTNQYGAYLDWGLMKDLFCPFREQKTRMQVGQRYQVYCYIDDITYRIVCTSKIDRFMRKDESTDPAPQTDQPTHNHTDTPKRPYTDTKPHRPSESTRRPYDTPSHRPVPQNDRTVMIGDFTPRLLRYLKDNDGKCPYHDKSAAEDIYSQFGVSKKIFKQAIGSLYKQGLIRILDNGLELA